MKIDEFKMLNEKNKILVLFPKIILKTKFNNGHVHKNRFFDINEKENCIIFN